jgi:hypothetical protein
MADLLQNLVLNFWTKWQKIRGYRQKFNQKFKQFIPEVHGELL